MAGFILVYLAVSHEYGGTCDARYMQQRISSSIMIHGSPARGCWEGSVLVGLRYSSAPDQLALYQVVGLLPAVTATTSIVASAQVSRRPCTTATRCPLCSRHCRSAGQLSLCPPAAAAATGSPLPVLFRCSVTVMFTSCDLLATPSEGSHRHQVHVVPVRRVHVLEAGTFPVGSRPPQRSGRAVGAGAVAHY